MLKFENQSIMRTTDISPVWGQPYLAPIDRSAQLPAVVPIGFAFIPIIAIASMVRPMPDITLPTFGDHHSPAVATPGCGSGGRTDSSSVCIFGVKHCLPRVRFAGNRKSGTNYWH